MASGQLITKANIAGNSYSLTEIWSKGSGGGSGTYYLYISAPCFKVEQQIKKNVLSTGRTMTMTSSYWNGSTWTDYATDTISLGWNDSGTHTNWFFHNCSNISGQDQSGSHSDNTSTEAQSKHLWRITLPFYDNYDKYVKLYIGTYHDSRYEATGKLIYSNGDLSDFYYWAGTTQSDAIAISKFRPSNCKGTLITTNNSNHIPYTTTL